MARRHKTRATGPKNSDLVPAPHNHLYTGRNVDEDRLVTTLLLAGEALAEPFRIPSPPRPDSPHANPVENAHPTIIEDFAELLEIVGRIRTWIAGDARRAELLTCLRVAFGDGESLKVMFQQFFPGQVSPPKQDIDGKRVLSDREVEVLRVAAGDLSHEEIAARLSISAETVHTHLRNIYKKLGVQRPMQAVARAVSMGFLDMDAVAILAAMSHCAPRNFGAFDTTVSRTACINEIPQSGEMKSLAEFGLFLMAASGTAPLPLGRDYVVSSHPPNVICELNAQGEIARQFGAEFLYQVKAITVAPLQAAQHGFTPGNLFVVQSYTPLRGTNNGMVVEFTPEGQFVRAFSGGKDIGTRLDYPTCLVFAADGRLLVGTSNTLLAFREGGASVQIFANGYCWQVCTDAAGRVYMTQVSSVGCVIKIFDLGGQLLSTFGGTSAGVRYEGIAMNSQGHIFVARTEHERAVIAEFTDDGEFQRSFVVPGFEGGSLAIDIQNRLYAPCQRTQDIKILSPDGKILRRIDLHGKVIPYALVVQKEGRLWVCGNAL